MDFGWRSGVGITKINDRKTYKWCVEQKRLLNENLCMSFEQPDIRRFSLNNMHFDLVVTLSLSA